MDRARQTAVICFALLIALGNKAGWLHLDLAALAIGEEQATPVLFDHGNTVLPRLALDEREVTPVEPPVVTAKKVVKAKKVVVDGHAEAITFPNLPDGMLPKEKSLDYAASEYRVCRVTAYHDRGTTASGVQSGVGQCAAPADIPFGSKVTIPALGRSFIVTDRTHQRFRHNTVDLFIPSREACLEFGRHYLEVIVVPPSEEAWPSRRGFVRAYEG